MGAGLCMVVSSTACHSSVPVDGELPHLLHPVIVIFFSHNVLPESGDIHRSAGGHIFSHLSVYSVWQKGVSRINSGTVEIPGLESPYHFEDGAADIVAANEHVRSGGRRSVRRFIGAQAISETGVRTEVTGIAHGFGLLIECSAHAAGARSWPRDSPDRRG